MKKKKIFIIIGVFWLIIIGGFVGYKEFTLRSGVEVLLKTRPVDPRDLFRGDYVILNYEISRIDLNNMYGYNPGFKKGDKIFVLLRLEDRIAKAYRIVKSKPNKGLYVKGTVEDAHGDNIDIKYGIESYFVPENKGRIIERHRGNFLVKVAVDQFGSVAIKSLIMDGDEIDLGKLD